jgi:hypothetical protein
MNSDEEWKNVGRIAWATGGIVATNEPGPNVEVSAGLGGRSVCKLSIASFKGLFDELSELGFKILGTTFITSPEELQGLRVPEFRTMSPAVGWPAYNARQSWRQIVFAAAKSGHMPLMGLASRISLGLRYGEIRLRDLVAAYSAQLRGRLHHTEPKDYEAFKDANSFEVYKSIHALFWELAVLRDTLAEFVAFTFSLPKLRTMSGLRKALRNSCKKDSLADEILQATDPSGGWIATFTDYRNFFTHISPMEEAANLAFALQDKIKIRRGQSIPQLYYPLPQNIGELTHERSAGFSVASLDALRAEARRRHDRATEPDAMEYLHGCLNRFADLASALISRSPIAPKAIVMTPEDIIGKVRVL